MGDLLGMHEPRADGANEPLARPVPQGERHEDVSTLRGASDTKIGWTTSYVLLLQPLHLLLMMFAGWVNRHQLDVIDYLKEENRVLKERVGGRRICFTNAERRRLARKAYALGRKVLNELETLVTPDTLLRWHRPTCGIKVEL